MHLIRLLLALCFSFTLFSFAFGQHERIDEDLKLTDKIELDYRVEMVEAMEAGTYLMKLDKRKSAFLEYHEYGKTNPKSIEIDLSYGAKEKKIYEFCIPTKDKIYVFTAKRINDIKKHYLFVEEIDKKTFTISSKARKLMEINYYESKYAKESKDYSFVFSTDLSKILLYYDMPPDKRKNEIMKFHVYDLDLNLVWEKKTKVAKEDERKDVEKVELDNDGNIHIFKFEKFEKPRDIAMIGTGFQINDGIEKTRKLKSGYEYLLESHYQDGSESKETRIRLPEYFITDMQMVLHPKQGIVLTGLCAPENSLLISDFFYFNMDSGSHEVKNLVLEKLEKDLISIAIDEKEEEKLKKLEEKKNNKKTKAKLFDFDVNEVIFREDGGVYIVMEEVYNTGKLGVSYTPSTTGPGMDRIQSNAYDRFKNIIVFSRSASGELEWAKKVEKKQKTTNDVGIFSSYSLFKNSEDLFFLFNDNPKNFEEKDASKKIAYNKINGSGLICVKLDKSGKESRDEIWTRPTKGPTMCTEEVKQISNNKVLLYSREGKGYAHEYKYDSEYQLLKF